MNIYNPLEYTGKSFTSSVKETFQQQEAKKQASIERMNETLRTQAAQGRLGSLANSILNDALTQASEQGLIGVNQYEIMNQAMPKFYAAKSAVTDLNNSYNAELKAAQADDSINVDANFLAYLNEKYYSDDVTLENIDAHAANVVNKGFNIAEHTEFLNEEYILDKVIPTMVTQFSESEYGVVGQEEGMDVFGTTTTTGVVRANVDNIANFTANPQVEAFLIKKAREANPNVDITNLNLQVPKAEQVRIMNEVLDAKFPTSTSIAGAGVSRKQIIEMGARAERANIKYRNLLEQEELNELSKAKALIKRKRELNPDLSVSAATEALKAEKIGDKPRYNANYLNRAFAELTGGKPFADQLLEQQNKQNASLIYDQTPMETVDDLKKLMIRDFGDVDILDVKEIETEINEKPVKQVLVEIRISKDEPKEVAITLDEKGKPTPESIRTFKDVLVSQAYGDRAVRRSGGANVSKDKSTNPFFLKDLVTGKLPNNYVEKTQQ